jgi:hypothetical protein
VGRRPAAALLRNRGGDGLRKGVDMTRGAGLAVRERSEEGGGSGSARGWWADGKGGKKKERRGGCAGLGREEREREGLGGFGEFSFFFKIFSKLLFNFKFKLCSKHFKIFTIILKAFKTSHKQIIKPCIQIMMHKHLLLLNY